MPHKDSVAVFRTWYAPIIELARFLAGVRARPGIRRTESRRRTIRSHGNGSRLPRRCVVFIAKPTRRELAPLETVAFLEVASLLLTVVRQRSFFPSQWGWRQGMFAPASCRSTSGLDAAVPHCNF